MEKRVFTVLRSGGDFQPRHVQGLQRQLAKWAPSAKLICMSDVDVSGVECIPLKYDYPGWWAKLELMRPDIPGDFLFTDLDNVILGPLDDMLAVEEYTTQVGECNAWAYYTEEAREEIWLNWRGHECGIMHDFDPRYCTEKNSFGDGGFIKSLIYARRHWEEMFPGQVTNLASLKSPMRLNGPWTTNWPLRVKDIPKDTRVLLCWRPWRPWVLPAFRNLY